ncbi:hypothetical protein VTK26DRAFT_3451 [Humicola hyalothermophila]
MDTFSKPMSFGTGFVTHYTHWDLLQLGRSSPTSVAYRVHAAQRHICQELRPLNEDELPSLTMNPARREPTGNCALSAQPDLEQSGLQSFKSWMKPSQ